MTALLLLAASLAAAEEVRVGIFVGNNQGASSQAPLVFAQEDAVKMHELFTTLGDIPPGDAFLLLDEPRRNVHNAFVLAQQRLAAAEARGAHTTLVFYYSGHGDETGLDLGSTRLTFDDLRAFLDSSEADVRVGFLDACQSGGVMRQKGGTRGPSYAFAVDAARLEGTALVTSSAATEFSQESEEIGGGFFTHYLHGALTGAADVDGDGDVTLAEAYGWVHAETAFATRDAPASQRPHRDIDLAGEGEIRLTRLSSASSRLRFEGDMEGTYAIWDESRRRYVAEVDGRSEAVLAVRPGNYFIQHRLPGWVDQAEIHLREGDEAVVDAANFASVAYEHTASRGDLARTVRKATLPGLTLRGSVGIRSFGDTPVGTRYLPTHGVAGIEARWLGRRPGPGPFIGVDLLGGVGTGRLSVTGLDPIDLVVSSTSVGVTTGFATAPNLVRAGAGGRAEIILFTRNFPGSEAAPQSASAIAPGVQAWAGVHHGRALAELSLSLMHLSVDIDGLGAPTYGEIMLSSGYRF